MNMEKVSVLFDGWEEAMIWSCLQGCMGEIIADDPSDPQSAMLSIGDFHFLAGLPNASLFRSFTGFQLLIPKDVSWEQLIERHYGEKVTKILRYAIKKEPDTFDQVQLAAYCKGLAPGYELKLFDRALHDMALSTPWSYDLCSQFKSYEDYEKRAVGIAILHEGMLVSGASTYAVYQGGIEIEIDTMPEFRRRGLAKICGAALILECLKRNLYPSLDAHDLRSVSLAETLGTT